ncbi:DegT/DnrJ/EryC1/StrS family aminotransferase [Terrabacter sp. BE26]|uniref:DegT/DnrJ/EryC1/StrS family aminotransferase n=1 Tax=Terrabacter sp. BE26 TaxID=2898152 RepID=UPI0035BE3666
MTATSQVRRPPRGGREIAMTQPWFDEREVVAAAAAVQSGWASQGARVIEFEAAVAALVHVPYTVAVSSCTAALHLGMVAYGVGPGDDVVVPSLSFVATANAVRFVGARPVFADVDPRHHNITAATVEQALTPATKAVIAVDQYGTPADMEPIRALARERGLSVVEDAACAIGSVYRGRPVGAASDFAAFSFHPRTLLVTGEGGMVTTSDPGLAERVRRLRQHGMSVSTFHRHHEQRPVTEEYLETGYNYRLTDIQAAIGVVQAEKLHSMVTRRRELAAVYHELLAGVPGLQMVTDPEHGESSYQSFWVMLPDDFPLSRGELLAVLKRYRINGRPGISCAHQEPAFSDLDPVTLPVSERIARRSVLLPMFHAMTREDQQRVADVVCSAWSDPEQLLG